MNPKVRTGVAQAEVSVVNLEEAAYAASYTALLTDDSDLAARTWSTLGSRQNEWGLVVGGRQLCSVLRPRFIGEARAMELGRVSQTIAALLERIGEHLLSSDRLLDRVGASDAEREIWSIDPGFPGFTLTSRLDSFMVGTHPLFIEYNAESPAGIAFCDALSDVFRALPAFQRWASGRPLRDFQARTHLLDTLLWAYRAWGGSDTPSVAVIDWAHVLTRRDFELCADFFRANGVPTVIVDPRELGYRAGGLWYGEERITLVYRRVLLHELLDHAEEAGDLLQAYRDGAVCMVNSPRSKLLHKKALFALLDDGSIDVPMTEDERSTVARCIPWTRLVQPGHTTYRGHDIDLVSFVLDRRERLAIKPVDDYGGKGVVLGWEATPDDWEAALERAMAAPHVVQERVPMPHGEFPVWNGGVALESMLIDTDPLLFRNEMGGILTRISSNSLLNVSAGTGSAAPTFVVPEGG